jgi:hypothetical protein
LKQRNNKQELHQIEVDISAFGVWANFLKFGLAWLLEILGITCLSTGRFKAPETFFRLYASYESKRSLLSFVSDHSEDPIFKNQPESQNESN